MKTNYPSGNYVLAQDGAAAYTAKKVQKFCNEHFTDFWLANFWPSSSPDLNPLDYAIWGTIVHSTSITSQPIFFFFEGKALVLE